MGLDPVELFLTGGVPFTPSPRFSASKLLVKSTAAEALLSMAYYCGYLTFEYSDDNNRKHRLVSPSEDMRRIFVKAIHDQSL